MTSRSVRDREIRRSHTTRRDTEHTEFSHIHLEGHPIFPLFLVLSALSPSTHLHLVVQIRITLRQSSESPLLEQTLLCGRLLPMPNAVLLAYPEFEHATGPLRVYVYDAPPRGMLPTAGLSARWFGPGLWPIHRVARIPSPHRLKLVLTGDRADTDDSEIGLLITTEPMLEIDRL